jgi:hypothetical protein
VRLANGRLSLRLPRKARPQALRRRITVTVTAPGGPAIKLTAPLKLRR